MLRSAHRHLTFALAMVVLAIDWQSWFQVPGLAFDIAALGLMLPLARELGPTLSAIFRSPGTALFSVRTEMLRGALAMLGLLFFLLWLSHWLDQAPENGEPLIEWARYKAYLHAGAGLALVTAILRSSRVSRWLSRMDVTPGRRVLLLYGVAALAATFILIMPWSLQPGASIALIDAFFIAVSAVSVTGLATVNVPETFSQFGLLVILALIQLGGLGIVVVSALLAFVTRKRLSMSAALMGRELYDAPGIGDIPAFIAKAIGVTLIAEAVGTVWIYASLPADTPQRFFHSLFHSISAFCNAGFSSFPSNLELPALTFLHVGVALLVILGGIGFPVIFDLLGCLRLKKRFKPLSPNTILTLWLSGGLLLVGTVGIFTMEMFWHADSGMGIGRRLAESMFYSVSSRTAGFNITPVSTMNEGTQLFIAFLMVIGGAPISTAGGIKVTTAAVVIISALSVLRGHKWIQFGKREISPLVLQKAVAVMVLYTVAMFSALLLLLAIEQKSAWALTFEVVSALSTVGLSLGVTEQLSFAGKAILIVLMFTGRLGLVTMVYTGVGKVIDQRFRYPEERFHVG